jgi:O-methyltransferase
MPSFKNFLKRLSADPVTRRKAQNKFYERRLKRHNLHLYKAHLNWTMSETLQSLHEEWGETPGIPPDRCYFLHAMGRIVATKSIPGDTAECGVRFGKSTFFLLKAIDDPTRPHRIFDSFAGLSQTGAHDTPVAGIKAWSQGDISVEEQMARDNLAAFPNCHFYKGWIPERFGEVADRSFALAHIDVDLYQPTLDSLEFFYAHMNAGGLIICDDYGFASCPGATKAFDEFFAGRAECLIPIPTGQCLVQKV